MAGYVFDLKSLTDPVILEAALQVEAGSCVALSGASGAGKSRFLRALADLDPNNADIWLAGKSRAQFRAPDWRRCITYVAAESGWWAEQVGAHFHENDLESAHQLMLALGLPPNATEWDVARLSTGERQRLALVRALVQEPDVLLLDEPTAPLDEKSTESVEKLLTDFLAQGGVVFLVTHDAAQAVRLADRFLEAADMCIREVCP